jgi:hypothetical protein
MGKTERRLPRERARSGREPLRRRGHASTGLSTAQIARFVVLVRTVVSALGARSAVGDQSASTVVSALIARSAVVHQYASTVVCAIGARSAVVHQSASTVVGALSARSAVGDQSASTVVYAVGARSAGNSSLINETSVYVAQSLFTAKCRYFRVPGGPSYHNVGATPRATLHLAADSSSSSSKSKMSSIPSRIPSPAAGASKSPPPDAPANAPSTGSDLASDGSLGLIP